MPQDVLIMFSMFTPVQCWALPHFCIELAFRVYPHVHFLDAHTRHPTHSHPWCCLLLFSPYYSVPQFPLLCGHFSFTTSAFLIRASFPPSFNTSPPRSLLAALPDTSLDVPLALLAGALPLSLGAGNIPRTFPFLLLCPTSSTWAATHCFTSSSVGPLSSLRRSDCCHSSCTIVPRGREPPAAMFGATPCWSGTSPSPHSFHSLKHSILIVLSSFSCHPELLQLVSVLRDLRIHCHGNESCHLTPVAVQFVWLGSSLLPSVLETYNLTNFSNTSVSTGDILRPFLMSTGNRPIFWLTSQSMPCDKHSRATIPPRE